jgi:thiosulfate dehydrogenase
MNIHSSSKTILVMVLLGLGVVSVIGCQNNQSATTTKPATDTVAVFQPPDTSTIPHDDFGDMVRYGRDLVINTARYLGPSGTVGHYLGNKMNCESCHLDAGTRPFGYNFFSAHARYPQYRGRENAILDLSQRVNNCIERPMCGKPLPLDSKEMTAIVCYMKWLATGVPVGKRVNGDDLLELEYPKRAADPQKGEKVYTANCASCHGPQGQGQMQPDSSSYLYPPLWGEHSFQKGSSPSRVLKLAAFIKANMPYQKAYWNKPVLTDEESIDVAAFINDDRIHPRPQKNHPEIPDYPNLKVKPIDYDKGPYLDSFSEFQHKFGPYQPIIDYYKAHNLKIVL